MTRRCTICDHQARAQIEAELLAGTDSQEAIAGRYGTTRRALGGHLRKHMDKPLSLAQIQEEAPSVLDQLTGTPQERMNKLIEIAAALLAKAVRQSSVDTQIRGLGELRKVVELMEKVAGNLPPETIQPLIIVIDGNGKQTGQAEPRRADRLLLGQP